MKETSEKTANKPLIFLTNDDGVNAKGLRMLIETLRQKARLLVVAPEQAQSGMGHAITLTRPLYLKKVTDEPGLSVYACNGTPVDCVKIAFDCMMLGKEMPSLVVSGINHGSNSAINVLYSGTMGAAIEGGFYDIPSIGFSLLDHDEDADFSAALSYVRPIIERAMNSDALGRPLCLNVNVPNLPADQIKGIKASVVMTEYHGLIYLSARSIDEVNVQVMMEKLGGGGHRTIAGAQLSGISMDEAKDRVKAVIDEMLQKGDIS